MILTPQSIRPRAGLSLFGTSLSAVSGIARDAATMISSAANQTEKPMSPDLRIVFGRRLVQKNLIVALFVGTILNLINQLDFLLAGQIDLVKLCLTYCVPFFVASYGSYNSLRSMPHD
jgi:hypothetical protein